MNNVEEKVIRIIGKVVNVTDEITKEMPLRELGYDSLKNVELVVELEDELKMRFDDSKLAQNRLETVKDVIGFVLESMD